MEDFEIKTALASSNIALIKYWGRRDSKLNLPFNSSLSLTLDGSISTRTSVLFSRKITNNAIYIDGKKFALSGRNEKISRIFKVVTAMKKLGNVNREVKVLIVSKNSFPMGAGIASSASGGAALVYAVNDALGLDLSMRGLSIYAREISGSACRSIPGGIVRWRRGKEKDGSDSYAEKMFDSSYWEELRDLVVIVSNEKKRISSSEGHDITSSTSELFSVRPALAEKNIRIATDLIRKKNFERLGEIIMRDSNNMHAAMMDSWPPIIYLNDVSRAVIQAVEKLNGMEGRIIVAYTFDAGPNPHLITLRGYEPKVEEALKNVKGIKRVIKSSVGDGAKPVSESLIDHASLAPC